MNTQTPFRLTLVALAVPGLFLGASVHAQEVLKIGVNGVMSGEAASWGLVNKYCAETTADIYNGYAATSDKIRWMLQATIDDDRMN